MKRNTGKDTNRNRKPTSQENPEKLLIGRQNG